MRRQPEPTIYTGTPDDLQRERRMSEWQRAMKLPSAQRESVQARMIADPYDREASTRMERINQRLSGSRVDQRAREVAALQEYEATPATIRGQQPSNSDSYQRTNRRLSRGSAGGDGIFTVGSVNGNAVVAPTAGNYNTYNSQLSALGLGDSPSPEAFKAAMDHYRLDPNTVYKANADMRVAELRQNALNDKQRQANLAKQQQLAEKNKAAQEKNTAAERKQFQTDFTKGSDALRGMRSNDGYGRYMSSYQGIAKGFKDMKPEDQIAALDAAGLQYTVAERRQGGRVVKMPVMVNRGAFDAYAADPARRDNEASLVNQITRTPGGSRAYSDYANQQYPEAAQQALAYQQRQFSPENNAQYQEAQLQEAAVAIANAIQNGMAPEEVLQRVASDPTKRQVAVQVLQRMAPRDRILSTQVGR